MTATRGEMHHNQALQLDHTTTITAVQEDQPYKFLGTKEHALQDSRLMREETAKKFLQRSWLIWSSPQAKQVQGASYNYFCSTSPDIPHADYTLA